MHNNNYNKFVCRICGHIKNEPPWGEDGKSPTFNICTCCGVEYGYEDCCLEAIRAYREEWLSDGGNWKFLEFKPENWNLEEQMKNIPEEYR